VIEIVDIVEKEACLGRGLALLLRADQGVQLCLCSAEGGVVERAQCSASPWARSSSARVRDQEPRLRVRAPDCIYCTDTTV
jgi:hypothetical protein